MKNGKWILCVSNGVYTLFKTKFLAAPQCFIKLFLIFKASYIFYGETIPVTPSKISLSKWSLFIWSWKSCISFKLFTDLKEKSYLPTDLQYSRCLLKKYSRLIAGKTHGFFCYLKFRVSCPPWTTSLEFPHFSLMSTSLILVNSLSLHSHLNQYHLD